jgi:tripeptidyl-peptidase I
MVQPTTFFGLRAQRSGLRISDASASIPGTIGNGAVAGCLSDGSITPACLSNLYNFNSTINYTKGLMGVAGFLEQYPSKEDLTKFMESYSPHNAAQTFTCLELNHNSNTTCGKPGVSFDGTKAGNKEANLDVQYARSITQSIPNIYYSTFGSPPWLGTLKNTNEPYLEFLNYLLGLNSSSLPNTISISYGDDEGTVPLAYATNVCNLFSQLGVRGVSVLVASGDSGVGRGCLNNQPRFSTAFPAGCPWVTTVGGTSGTPPEAAWTSGGAGFSEVFGRPSYQNDTVNKWLSADKNHNTTYFNISGRAYPDVAAQATNYPVMVDGSVNLLSGTSCATPTFASIIQLLNSDRLANGKTALGFLNPWLYSNATTGLNDITHGHNTGGGCRRASITGFTAVAVCLLPFELNRVGGYIADLFLGLGSCDWAWNTEL